MMNRTAKVSAMRKVQSASAGELSALTSSPPAPHRGEGDAVHFG